jgi:hypothetical protein
VPRVSFDQQFKSADTERFPKLKLDTAEKSRLWIPGKEEPWMEWSHRIEAPVIEHGEPVMEVKDTRRGPIETWKMDWIGNVFCLGETGTPGSPGPLMLEGIDPGNCPACESASKQTGVAPPQQRFALPVVKFKVRGRGQNPYDLSSPISAEILIWAYTARIHGMLHELEAEHEDLHRHDIKMELEDTPGADKYQKIKQLAVIVKPAYTDPKVRSYLVDLWNNVDNRPTDEQLRDACQGRDVPRLVMMDMVRRAERQYRQAEQAGSGEGTGAEADAGFNDDLSAGVDALLDSGPAEEPSSDSGGGLEEFMSEEEKQAQFAAIEEAKRQAGQIDGPDLLAGDDPFSGETSPVRGATTTPTSAPAAERPSRTAPKSAASAGTSDPPKANGRKKAPAKSEQPSLDAPEPAPAADSSGGGIIDFDSLFSD